MLHHTLIERQLPCARGTISDQLCYNAYFLIIRQMLKHVAAKALIYVMFCGFRPKYRNDRRLNYGFRLKLIFLVDLSIQSDMNIDNFNRKTYFVLADIDQK